MHYDIDVGGRRRRVTVDKSGDGFAVAVDGKTHQVDVARVDGHSLSLIVDSMWSVETSVTPEREPGHVTVHVGGTAVPVAMLNGRKHYGRKRDDGGAGAGPQRVTAPMPGKIVRVPVALGDIVRARQPVVVVEAMKMENELRAGRDGKVAEIHAREGMSVDAGALLIVIQ
jgi:biotin carboxyl carrier protein